MTPDSHPLVSVVIPTWNRLARAGEAIASVLCQTYPAIELIIVDDGSTDGTVEAYREDRRWRFLETEERRSNRLGKDVYDDSRTLFGRAGVSAARNLGIGQAKGSFIAFLDSDDLWLPEKVAKQVAFFQSHPDLLIAQTEETWYRRGQRVNPRPVHRKYEGDIFARALPRCIVSPSGVMIRKELFDHVGLFDEDFPVCEDYELWLRVAARYPVGLLEEALTIKHGGHSDQLSKLHSLDYYRFLAIRKLLDGDRLSPLQQDQARREMKKKSAIYTKGCLKRGRKPAYV